MPNLNQNWRSNVLKDKADKIAFLYTKDLLSIYDISRQEGIAKSTVRYTLLLLGVKLRSRKAALLLKSEEISRRISRDLTGKKKSSAHKESLRRAALKRGERTARGWSRTSNGYIRSTRGAYKGEAQHRVVMIEKLGRKLLPHECVHHIDGNKTNNHPDNLAIMTRSAHTALHRRAKCLA